MKMKRLKYIRFAIAFLASAGMAMGCWAARGAEPERNPKREFRGAWLHVIGQTQWQNKSTAEAKKYIDDQFQKLLDAGCNAVIFQVRPTADAMYKSEIEPWTSWLTGARGKAPVPEWDPMEYAIERAHERGMEFHAWLNPYRVTSTPKEILPADHLSKREPHRFVKFNGQTFFDPAYKENRDYICEVVRDIVSRYDVDAIHIDDYFYPYPVNGKRFNGDNESYARFGNGMDRNQWRRDNVDMLIQDLSATIKGEKPWVRFGVSPFGIWRNRSNDPRGSESSGLQNYDDLYADVLLWAKNGWIDYLVPQLYWTLDMKAAPSRGLAKWWNDNTHGVDLYIGQDVQRTMNNSDPDTGDKNELATKVRISRELPNVKGNVWWHGYWVTSNMNGVADSLALKHQSTIALPPAYGKQGLCPESVEDVGLTRQDGKVYLTWTAPAPGGQEKETDAIRFVVYQFFPGEKVDIEDSQAIIALTPATSLLLGDSDDSSVKGCTFVVTSLDRMNRESDPVAFMSR